MNQPEVIIKYKEAEPFIVDCYCKYLFDLFNNSGLFDDCFGENRVDYKKRYYDRLKENQNEN